MAKREIVAFRTYLLGLIISAGGAFLNAALLTKGIFFLPPVFDFEATEKALIHPNVLFVYTSIFVAIVFTLSHITKILKKCAYIISRRKSNFWSKRYRISEDDWFKEVLVHSALVGFVTPFFWGALIEVLYFYGILPPP